MEEKVTVYQDITAKYPDKKYLFRPSEQYSEYLFKHDISKEKNDVYRIVRESFRMYGLDTENYGSSRWNPLKNFVRPGDYVVIKPNLVMDFNPSDSGTDCLYTHPAVVAAVVDYVLIALKGKGRIVVGDAPMQECDFDKLIRESGYDQLIQFYNEKLVDEDVSIEMKDFRGYTSVVRNGVHHGITNDNTNHGIEIDLGENSEFVGMDSEKLDRLRINSYNPAILKQHHDKNKHEYLINREIMEADVIINMPKPKTHRKAGVTIALKNLVGINVRKEYLPHHCDGDAKSGGDEYNKPHFLKKIKSHVQDRINYEADHGHYARATLLVGLRKCLTVFIRLSDDQSWDGSWYGNHTISKTITDLNKILFYVDQNGNLQKQVQRKYLIVADMIISGEKEGPIEPTAKRAGIIAVGKSPVIFDEAIATIMGMNTNKIPTLQQVRQLSGEYKLSDESDRALVISNVPEWNNKHINEIDQKDTMHFIPAIGWIGHIEL